MPLTEYKSRPRIAFEKFLMEKPNKDKGGTFLLILLLSEIDTNLFVLNRLQINVLMISKYEASSRSVVLNIRIFLLQSHSWYFYIVDAFTNTRFTRGVLSSE